MRRSSENGVVARAHAADGPGEPSGVDAPADAREKRTSSLFRRWPALDRLETLELSRLWKARMRAAKEVSDRRRGASGGL